MAAPKNLTAEERRLRAKVAAHARHSRRGDDSVTAAELAPYELEVDPLGVLPADERCRRARHAMKAAFYRREFEALKAARRAVAG